MERLPAIVLLIAMLGVEAWATYRSHLSYQAFKQVTDSAERRAALRRKGAKSFLLYGLGGIAALALLGRADALFHFPAEFAALRASMAIATQNGFTFDKIAGLVTGIAVGSTLVLLIWRFVFRKRSQPIIGDVSAYMPRNGAEAWTLVPVAINAGVSEEVFFRLALPLVATLATGSAVAGGRIAILAFGLGHWYQGWKGVLGVTLISSAFFNLYLATGSLLIPIVVHAAVDLMGLVVRPAISLWLDRRELSKRQAASEGEFHAA